MSDRQDKVRAVFFSAIMVLSVVALGSVGFVGGAAADTAGGAVDSNKSPGASPGETLNFSDNTVTVSEDTTFTSVNVSSSVSTAANISQISIFNSTTGEFLGSNSSVDSSGNTNVTFDSAVTNTSATGDPFRYTVEVGFSSDGNLQNETSLDITSAAFNNSANGQGFGGQATLSSSAGSNLVNVGNVSVQQFKQFNTDDRTNFNLSVTTPEDSLQGVNESSISVALNSSSDLSPFNQTNITVIENGNIVSSVANDNGTNLDFNDGNATYDIDVALPEEQGTGYNVTLLGNVTDDGGNIIERVNGGAKNISQPAENSVGVTVDMDPDSLSVSPDENKFANTDAGSDSGATADENATVNVTVTDRFGNGLNTSGTTDATVEFVGVASGTTITNISTFSAANRPGSSLPGKGTRNAPFLFNVSNSFEGDVDLTATDTDSSDTSVSSDSGTQTFVAPVNGVTLSTNRTALPADSSTEIQLAAQLTDSNGNAIDVPNIEVVFSNAGGFSDAGVNLGPSSSTTNSTGVATVNITADTAGQSFTTRGTEQKNTNTDTIQINTTTGEISDTNTQFLFNGTLVNGNNQDKTGSNAVKVATDHDVSVNVSDGSGNPIQDASVEYTFDGSTVATVTSDSDGFANTTVTLPQQRVTDAQLNASVGKFNASTSSSAGPADAQVNISTNATAATQLQFGSDARALPIDSQGDVDVEVVDEFGNINESVSQDVTLESSDTGVLNFSGNAQSDSQTLDSSSNKGTVTFTVDTASSAGSADLTAFTSGSGISNASDTFSVNEPASVEVTFDNDVSTSSSGNTKQIANLSAQLKGPEGSDLQVSGTTISFAQVSGSAAELNQSKENFQNTTNSSGVATIQVNATSETGDTTFRAVTNGGASGEGTITTTGTRNAIQLTPTSSTVTENDSVNVTATFVDSEGRIVPRTDSITVTPTLGSVGTTTQSTTFDSNGEANVVFNYTADGGTGEETLDAIGGAVTGTTNITVEEAQQQEPSVSVNFTDQTVPNGTEQVTVDSAEFTQADGSAGDYVVVVHTIDEFGAPVGEVSNPIGASGDLTGAEEDITVDLTAADGPIDSITEDVTLRAMLHTTDNNSAFGTRLGSEDAAIDGIEPGDETDDANITVEDEQTVNVGGQDVPVEFTTENDRGERIVTASNAVDAIQRFIEDDSDIDADTAVSVIRAFLESD